MTRDLSRRAGDAPRNWWWWEWEAAILALLVLAIYFPRLTAAPVCGEESRWADGAREMIASGDWIVPRQQGTVFPERPPLTSWTMALVGLARGEVDLVAIRLPSVTAILMLTLLIYAYARGWMSRLASFSSAAFFATFGQTLQLGRFGESEAVFTLLIAASLLIWHTGYLRGWPAARTWTLSYALAALAALAKGPQAPVYFVAASSVYLLWRRDWRWLFGWGHMLGACTFAAIVASWLVPFAMAERHVVDDIWTGLAQDRFSLHGLGKHLVSYPLETLGCLLPWSPILLLLAKPSVWRSVSSRRPQFGFLLTALAVTYPSVWLAAGARGRYYMPLYPCLAVLIGLVVEHCSSPLATAFDRLSWRRYLRGLSAVVLASGPVIVVLTLWPRQPFAGIAQPIGFLPIWLLAACATAAIVFWTSFGEQAPRPQIALVASALFLGLSYTGVVVNSRIRSGNDLGEMVATLKGRLPSGDRLVSFGRVYHRFAYCYGTQIPQVPWPMTADELPDDVVFFCFDRKPGDTPEVRAGGDDRLAFETPGTLPFAWETIAEIPCDPVRREEPHRTVVVGRVRREESMAQPPASRPVLR